MVVPIHLGRVSSLSTWGGIGATRDQLQARLTPSVLSLSGPWSVQVNKLPDISGAPETTFPLPSSDPTIPIHIPNATQYPHRTSFPGEESPLRWPSVTESTATTAIEAHLQSHLMQDTTGEITTSHRRHGNSVSADLYIHSPGCQECMCNGGPT